MIFQIQIFTLTTLGAHAATLITGRFQQLPLPVPASYRNGTSRGWGLNIFFMFKHLSTILLLFALIACSSPKSSSLSVIELTDSSFVNDKQSFVIFCDSIGIAPEMLQQHGQRLIIVDSKTANEARVSQLREQFPAVQIIHFENDVYHFDAQKHCNTPHAKQRQYIVLSTQLVADTHMQNQYLHYHEHQFELWPEVAKGFCQAAFDELIIFKHERELMLIIALDASLNFETQNAKTTLNNPRVDEWNALMAKYQTSRPGETDTWIFYSPIK